MARLASRLLLGLGLLGFGYHLTKSVIQGRRIQRALDKNNRSERLEPHQSQESGTKQKKADGKVIKPIQKNMTAQSPKRP